MRTSLTSAWISETNYYPEKLAEHLGAVEEAYNNQVPPFFVHVVHDADGSTPDELRSLPRSGLYASNSAA